MNKLIVGVLIIIGIVFGLLFWLAWLVLEKFEPGQVRFWAALVTACGPFVILAVYSLGFYLGKVEARGALSGIDQATERIARVVGQTVNVRDASRIRVQNTVPQTGAPVVLFPMNDHPQVTHRSGREAASGDIIDLSDWARKGNAGGYILRRLYQSKLPSDSWAGPHRFAALHFLDRA